MDYGLVNYHPTNRVVFLHPFLHYILSLFDKIKIAASPFTRRDTGKGGITGGSAHELPHELGVLPGEDRGLEGADNLLGFDCPVH